MLVITDLKNRINCLEQIKFNIELFGNGFEDRWPRARILINDSTFFDGIVQNNLNVEFTADVNGEDEHSLIIDYYNRNYKKDVVLDSNNSVVSATSIVIQRILFDDINVGMLPYNLGSIAVYEPWYLQAAEKDPTEWPNPRLNDLQLSWNSRWILKFTSPVYVWLLENL